jgi:hypothetical protein
VPEVNSDAARPARAARVRHPGSALLPNGKRDLEEIRRNFLWSIDTEEAMICLMSAKGKEPFYARYGFLERPNAEFGAGMIQFIRRTPAAQPNGL